VQCQLLFRRASHAAPSRQLPCRRISDSFVAHRAERTIALLAFEDVKAAPMADLLDIAQRQKTASELNAAILASQDLVRFSRLCPGCLLHCRARSRCACMLGRLR
jgi:CTLH/CRA C-terminal to LisH motif domain